ncbi:hypothetical protein [Streptomyces sp. CA-111067]|uniref:hypothetical protein n=1 Tax=Streptomyces sp. CA-111067 TaxID=3240046 RepID=UPI003D9923D1
MAGALTALVTLATASGCDSAPGERACTLVGASSGVTADIPGKAGTAYRMCVDTRCDTRTAPADSRTGTGTGTGTTQTSLNVPLPDTIGATEVTVHYTETPQGSTRPTLDQTLPLTLTKGQPNGPGCQPTVYQGRLTYTTGKGLTPRQ